ncbi:MAG: ParB/RepB/Spo0J family partition protein [Syntrophales bacterium]|nr:ParB/RepB/Spo0J family partition protein [Syntrophales bacterium]
MAFDYEVLAIKRVPLKDLVLGKGQVRKTQVSRDISELADSIKVVGQLQPIVICESSVQPGKFEILTGQRRYLACKEIGQEDIWAMILDRPIPELEAKVISFTENLIKRDPNKADYTDMCNHLYKIYGNVKIIAEKTGLPGSKVREYLKYTSLCPELKAMVDKGGGAGGVDQKTALRVQIALEKTGEVDPKIAVALAQKMRGMIGAQQQEVVEQVEVGGVTTVEEAEEIAKAAKKRKQYVKLIVQLAESQNKALNKYAQREGMKREDAAQSLITEALDGMGLLEEEE